MASLVKTPVWKLTKSGGLDVMTTKEDKPPLPPNVGQLHLKLLKLLYVIAPIIYNI